MNKSDLELKQDIEAELLWDPEVNSAQIGVTVDDGAISLFGTVDTYAQKRAVEQATKRIGGVRAVAQDLEVRVLPDHERTDAQIAAAVHHALSWNVLVPATVTGKVEHGAVTLEGRIEGFHQRLAAEQAIRHLPGVVAVFDCMVLESQAVATGVTERVTAALERHASRDARSIQVEAFGGTVTLSGQASSWQSVEDATKAAWAAPGVTEVVSRVQIAARS